MNKNLSRSWFVAITLVAGFALASCGGGGGGDSNLMPSLTPLEQALADRDAAQTALEVAEQRASDAEAARMAAETARMAAEEAASAAETAKMAAEDARDTADRLRMEAETAAMNSASDAANKMLAAQEAEQRAIDAEADKMTAESERDAANMRAEAAESERDAAVVTARYTEAKNDSDQAKAAYVAAMATYGRIDANVDEANKLVNLAGAAQKAANAAKSVAADGTDAQQTEAANAVTAANAAVSAANAEHAEAVMTEAALPYDKAIRTPATTPVISAMAARTGDDVTVEVTEDVAEGDASDAGNGWYRADVENEDDSAETATVYTNIENTMMLFSVVNTADRDSIDSVADTGVLTLESDGITADGLDDLNDLAKSGDFPHSPDGELTITYDDATDSEHERTFSGSFDKVPGDFSCDGETCTITADADGDITGLVGTWTFIPDYLGEDNESMAGEGETEVASRKDDLTEPMVEVVDVDHLVFGWWTKVDEDDDSVAFRTFSDGTQTYDGVNIGDLEGTATYEGPAAGRYAVKTFTGNAKINSIRTGEFTATAELMATFGGDDVAVSQQNQISGRIHTFMDENDDQLLGELALGTGDLDNLGNSTSFDGDVTGGVGGSPATGSWSGQFFGEPPADPTDNVVDVSDDYPNSVAGEFDASSSHGSVCGRVRGDKIGLGTR